MSFQANSTDGWAKYGPVSVVVRIVKGGERDQDYNHCSPSRLLPRLNGGWSWKAEKASRFIGFESRVAFAAAIRFAAMLKSCRAYRLFRESTAICCPIPPSGPEYRPCSDDWSRPGWKIGAVKVKASLGKMGAEAGGGRPGAPADD